MTALLLAVRAWLDRRRHPARHAAVISRLANIPRPRKVLVVCTGNVCRSPYLEAVLRRELPEVRIASAGFVGFDRSVPPNALAAAARRGIDLLGFRSRTLEAHRARTADLVVVMDERQARYLVAYAGVHRWRIVVAGDLDPVVSGARTVEDPWTRPIEVFESTFDRLDRCASTLIAQWRLDRVAHSATERTSTTQASTAALTPERVPQPVI